MTLSDFEYTEKHNFGTIHVFGEKKFNIMSEDCVIKLDKKIVEINTLEKPAAVILHGNKKSFLAGLDINTFSTFSIQHIGTFAHACCKLMNRFETSNTFFLSAINGYCLGGGLELAMATDYIIASRDAKFGLPEIKLGLIPGADGIKRLVRCVGKRRAMDLILTGRIISAKEALEIGLINEVVSRWKLMKRSEEIATDIASKNPVAVKAIKRLAGRASQYNITNEEIKSFQECLKTEYAQKAIFAFLNRKK